MKLAWAALASSLVATPLAAQSLSPGDYLARAGDCIVCHTVSQGRPYAGGLKMNTPVGIIYSTNITPDPDTGIGRYSFDDFARAVREGVAKDGHHLYPAMPYPSYARINDADLRKLYDFFMKEVTPVKQTNTPNEIAWPLDMRWPLALWNTVGGGTPFREDERFDAPWNRGAYLVEGLGHCGACHTPRGLMFQEKGGDRGSGTFLSGANLDNWSAPNLRSDLNTGLGRWSEAEVAEFLKTGHNGHASAFGTMRDVVTYSTAYLTDDDRAAMARYLKSLPPAVDRAQPVWVYDLRTAAALGAQKPTQPGSATYLRQCASCHGNDGRGGGVIPPLAGAPVVLDPDATSLVNLVLNGAPPREGAEVPDANWMPQFRTFLSDSEIATVVGFIRNAWGNHEKPPTGTEVGKLRQATSPADQKTLILHMR